MSPSRIPRPGGGGVGVGSPGGGGGGSGFTSSPLAGSVINNRPTLGTIVHAGKLPTSTTNANSTQHPSHSTGNQPPNHGSPTPSTASTLSVGKGKGIPQRRRPKPPSPEMDDSTTLASHAGTGGGTIRRPVPVNQNYSHSHNGESPSSLPRPRLASGSHAPGSSPTLSPSIGLGLGHPSGGHAQRTIIRQPSTPALGSARDRLPSPGIGTGTGRPRAVSSASVSAQKTVIIHYSPSTLPSPAQSPAQAHAQVHGGAGGRDVVVGAGSSGGGMRSLPSQKLFESSFLEHREPPVPPHIRVRLRLIHQLGVVLGIDAIGISGKIDIPGLLARVDQAYDRDREKLYADPTSSSGAGYDSGTGMNASASGAVGAGPKGGKGGNGVLGMFKRLGGGGQANGSSGNGGKRGVDEGYSSHGSTRSAEGPAFGVSLSEAPPGSWCTSLIGGQKHDLPLVVFTVVEEIYRRGMSQPGIFRLAGDGVRISSLTKVFNLPPLYGDSLSISAEPIHNLTGLIKRYIRDLPEPILDESIFPAFFAFCVEAAGDDNDGAGNADGNDRKGVEMQDDKAELHDGGTSGKDQSQQTSRGTSGGNARASEISGQRMELNAPPKEVIDKTVKEDMGASTPPSDSPLTSSSTALSTTDLITKLEPEPSLDSMTTANAVSQTTSAGTSVPMTVVESSTRPTLAQRITAAQILLKLLPPLHFSLFIYLLAFLSQLPLFPDNRLNVESISIIFGPAMCAARNKGISGLGPTVSSSHRREGLDPDEISQLVARSQSVLGWLLKHWARISERVLDEHNPAAAPMTTASSSSGFSSVAQTPSEGKEKGRTKKEKLVLDPRLLSPIDLRGSNETSRARKADPIFVAASTNSTLQVGVSEAFGTDLQFGSSAGIPSPVDTLSPRSGSISPSLSSSSPSPVQSIVQTPSPSPLPGPRQKLSKSTSHATLRSSPSSHSILGSGLGLGGLRSSPSTGTFGGGGGGCMKSSASSGGGLFARALSSMSISSQAQGGDHGGLPSSASLSTGSKWPKRSASFTSLSSLVKKVGSGGHGHGKGSLTPARSMSDDRDNARPSPSVNPQITSVLGSLHDLLVSKDKQIERDARELALLRHTLLEMDEKLQKVTSTSPLPGPVGINGCTCPIHPNASSFYSGSEARGGTRTVVIDKESNGHSSGSIKAGATGTPEITITSTPSTTALPTSTSTSTSTPLSISQTDLLGLTKAHEAELSDLQLQLSTALAGLEASRQTIRRGSEKLLELEVRFSKMESTKKIEVGKLQVALALEQARSMGLAEERDLARDRLEKVKTTLFSVA